MCYVLRQLKNRPLQKWFSIRHVIGPSPNPLECWIEDKDLLSRALHVVRQAPRKQPTVSSSSFLLAHIFYRAVGYDLNPIHQQCRMNGTVLLSWSMYCALVLCMMVELTTRPQAVHARLVRAGHGCHMLYCRTRTCMFCGQSHHRRNYHRPLHLVPSLGLGPASRMLMCLLSYLHNHYLHFLYIIDGPSRK